MSEFTLCPQCSISFGVPDYFLENRRKDNRQFFCPNGHTMSYRENLLDEARRERYRLKQQIAQKDDEIAEERRAKALAEKSAALAQKATARLKKRAHAGVCPDCNRTFSNMAQHMKTKHSGLKCETVKLKVVK